MRIGIDARMFGPKQGGLGRYIQQLILELEKIITTDEVVVFLRKENWNDFEPTNPRFTKALADVSWYSWREQTALPKIIKNQKIDLMHFPHWNVPLFYQSKFVVTIHDLLLLHYPTRAASTLGPFTYWFKNLAYRLVLNHAVKTSQRIIAPSEFTKQDIHKTLKIPLEKITVTHLAPFAHNSQALNLKLVLSESEGSKILNLHNITKPFALYVGVAYPHKNLDGLLRAWRIFTEKYGNDYQLILAGKKNYFYNQLETFNLKLFPPQRDPARGGTTSNVIFTDFVSDADLAKLYSHAALYVFPSLYEGFGLPPLEAMGYEVPVISSNSTCLPEILGKAAYYFDPANASALAEAIYRGFTDQNLRAELISQSKKLLLQYSWGLTAGQTFEIYQNSV